MVNGNAALHALVEPPPLSTSATTELGEAVAAAVIAIALAVTDYEEGAMSPTSRTWSGAMLGRLAQLRLDTFGEIPNFGEVARNEGRRALQGHPAGVLLTRLGNRQVDEVIDELIGYVIAISGKVVNDELALRAN